LAKAKKVFFCKECGLESAKWLGKCPSCNNWNSFIEEIVNKSSSKEKVGFIQNKNQIVTLDEVNESIFERKSTKSAELNCVLGGGFVIGSVILLGGEPGIGKSTLMLQYALQHQDVKILYVCGEESVQQIKLRANRLNVNNSNCYFTAETSSSNLLAQIKKVEPEIVIIDSIQTLYNPIIDALPGSISQIKQTSSELIHFAKSKNTTIVIVGHINKEGSIAGPKILEHMVDTVLYFEGDNNNQYRILRAKKNRFGNTSEIGIFEMTNSGLLDVSNPSEFLINYYDEDITGVTIGCAIEGKRPILVECQALVSPSVYGNPQRSSTGYNAKRINMLLAVLEKKCGIKIGLNDVFVNIAGGLRISDTSLDLAIITALLSSYTEISIPNKVCFIGEIGLSGEVRNVNNLEQRINEVSKLGFKKIIYPAQKNKLNLNGIQLHPIENIKMLFDLFFS